MEELEKPKRRPYITMSAGEIVFIFLILLALFGTWKVATFVHEYDVFKVNVINAVNTLEKRIQGK